MKKMFSKSRKFIIFFITFILLSGHTTLFNFTSSSYEVFTRSSVAKSLNVLAKTWNGLSTYDMSSFPGGSNFPTITNKTFLVQDDFVAFTDKLVYAKREEISLFVSSSRKTQIRIEYLDSTGTMIYEREFQVNQPKKNNYLEFNDQEGFDVSKFSKIKISKIEHNGWVQITVSTGKEVRYIPVFFEIDQIEAERKDALWVESTDTLKAYTSENGLPTNYESKNYPNSGIFTRPLGYPISYKIKKLNEIKANFVDCYDHSINADIVLKNAVKKIGYEFDLASDEAIEDFEYIRDYNTLIFGSQNEYWSSQKLQSIARYLDNGGKILILGGNTAWRFKEKLNSFDVFYGAGYKSTKYFPLIKNYFGSHYDSRGYTTFSGFSPAEGLAEFLGSPQSKKEFAYESNIQGCEEFKGASGFETDKLLADTTGFKLLARGNNPNNGGAEVLHKTFQSGGEILNFGSVALWHGMEDPKIKEILSTFLN